MTGAFVVFLAVSGYFLMVLCAAALLLFPPLRERVKAACGRAGIATGARLRALLGGGFAGMTRSARRLFDAVGTLARTIRAHRSMVLAAFAVIAVPPALALVVRTPQSVPFEDHARIPDRRIAQLLQGEQLATPARLPPEVFTTREVVLLRPTAAWASRDWDLLDDDFRQRLLVVFRLMRERHGYEVALLEGYRSEERQAALATEGPNVTRAGPGMSYHQYGLAADVAFLREGRLVISELDPWATRGYELYGALCEEVGLTWGGSWQMRDLGHVELRRPGVLRSARS